MVCADTCCWWQKILKTSGIAGTASVLAMDNRGVLDMVGEFGPLGRSAPTTATGGWQTLVAGRALCAGIACILGLMDARVKPIRIRLRLPANKALPVWGFAQKYNFSRRESLVQMVRYFGQALACQVRPSFPVYPLAHAALGNCGLTPMPLLTSTRHPTPNATILISKP
ncbi:MAG: hypothetical protein R2857_03145 [Vampirovibrionales bacterium]